MKPAVLDIRNMGEGLAALSKLGDARVPGELQAVSVVRITDGAKAHIAAAVPAKKIYVAPDPPAARSMFSKISSFPGVRAVFVSHRDDVLMCRNSYSMRGAMQRAEALARLRPEVLVDTRELFPEPEGPVTVVNCPRTKSRSRCRRLFCEAPLSEMASCFSSDVMSVS